jgi:Uma2 family endonuclease
MNREPAVHARVKLEVAVALQDSLKRSGLQGEVYTDGMAVKIADRVVHEPDAMLRLGAQLPGDAVLVTDPYIAVEVLSPSTGPVDTGTKLVNYFKLSSVAHYLVVNTSKTVVLTTSAAQKARPS